MYTRAPTCRIGKTCGNACIPMANNCRKTNPMGAPNKRTVKPVCKDSNISCGYSCIPPWKTCRKDRREYEADDGAMDFDTPSQNPNMYQRDMVVFQPPYPNPATDPFQQSYGPPQPDVQQSYGPPQPDVQQSYDPPQPVFQGPTTLPYLQTQYSLYNPGTEMYTDQHPIYQFDDEHHLNNFLGFDEPETLAPAA
jgi:hypothetical protein